MEKRQPRPHGSARMVNLLVFMCDQTPSRVSSHWNSVRSGLEVKRDILRQRHEINEALLLSNAALKLWNSSQLSQSLL